MKMYIPMFFIMVGMIALTVFLGYTHAVGYHKQVVKCNLVWDKDTGKDKCEYYKTETNGDFAYYTFLSGLVTLVSITLFLATYYDDRNSYVPTGNRCPRLL